VNDTGVFIYDVVADYIVNGLSGAIDPLPRGRKTVLTGVATEADYTGQVCASPTRTPAVSSPPSPLPAPPSSPSPLPPPPPSPSPSSTSDDIHSRVQPANGFFQVCSDKGLSNDFGACQLSPGWSLHCNSPRHNASQHCAHAASCPRPLRASLAARRCTAGTALAGVAPDQAWVLPGCDLGVTWV